jgi:hypothetical protein
MNITELIEELTKIKNEYGDLWVNVYNNGEHNKEVNWCDIKYIDVNPSGYLEDENRIVEIGVEANKL